MAPARLALTSSLGSVPLGVVGWSPDGTRLYAVALTQAQDTHPPLALCVINPGGTAPGIRVPVSFQTWYWRVAPDGSAVYALGFDVDPSARASIALDPTLLVALDPTTGAELSRTPLPGVKMGQRRETDARGARVYTEYFPALVFSRDGKYGYLAQPDEPLLDVLDLHTGRIDRTLRTDVPATS